MGKVVVFEGIDFSGKTTLISYVRDLLPFAQYFERLPRPFEDLRDTIHTESDIDRKFAFFFESNRARSREFEEAIQHYDAIGDRYLLSTFAGHNVMARQQDKEGEYHLLHDFKDFCPMDLLILLTINQTTLQQRSKERGAKYAHERDHEFLMAQQAEFKKLFYELGGKGLYHKGVIIDNSLSNQHNSKREISDLLQCAGLEF